LYVALAVPLTVNSPALTENIRDKEAIETNKVLIIVFIIFPLLYFVYNYKRGQNISFASFKSQYLLNLLTFSASVVIIQQ